MSSLSNRYFLQVNLSSADMMVCHFTISEVINHKERWHELTLPHKGPDCLVNILSNQGYRVVGTKYGILVWHQ